jgi:hypothetical protein
VTARRRQQLCARSPQRRWAAPATRAIGKFNRLREFWSRRLSKAVVAELLADGDRARRHR